ncbi:hypothetical protein MSAN_01666200 [Mycena sanguinolenta]|uniref:Uncharacterized protein n=1 Tax=Mycena sanguinolenta TaxID=230812 RepID=A0A8H7CUL1_9AGAR|nr:hypothetical protein MSAN_01666200 [Mycena sanguinolenta]
MMNNQITPQARQYAVADAPVFDADAALAEYRRNQANERPVTPPLQSTYSPPPRRQANHIPVAPPLQSTYSAPPQPHPRDRRGPAPQRPASMLIPASSQSNSRGMGYPRDNLSSSPEDAAPSSWSSRRMSMSEFPPHENWAPQTPPE